MNKIDELKQQLLEAEKEKKNEYINSQLEKGKLFINKCYSTHLFQRLPVAGKEIHLRKILNVKYDEHNNRLSYKTKNVKFSNYPQYGRFDFTIMEYNTHDPRPSHYGFTHELSLELFDYFLIEITAHADGYFDKIKHIFKQDDFITVGENSDDKGRFSWVSKYNKMIDLPTEGYQNIKDLLYWNKHPYVFNNQMIDTKESIQIVKDIADKIQENSFKWGGSVYERDYPRVQQLNSFYNLHIQKYL